MPTILFTRSIDNIHKQKLATAGFEVIEHNFLTINSLHDAEDTILKEFLHFKNLVFTSQHAVQIFFDVLNARHIALDPSVKIFSTSGETKNILEKYGYSPTLSAPAAEPLAHLMLEKIDLTTVTASGARQEGVHFICGNLSLPILPDILTGKGIFLKKIKVYETVKHPLLLHAVRSDNLVTSDAVVFFSLSAADAFLMDNKLEDSTIVFTLGATTAQYIKEKTGIKAIFMAEKPTIESLIQTIEKVLRSEIPEIPDSKDSK